MIGWLIVLGILALLLGLLLCLGQLQLHILKLIFLLGSLDA